jgi:S-adenosylmethionine:tRNA ribosyltransferase-isomerase
MMQSDPFSSESTTSPGAVGIPGCRTADFGFELPEELIAQEPAAERDASRLLVFRRDSRQTEHRVFRDLPDYFRSGDVLVLNDSRVIPARLRAINEKSGGVFEVFLLPDDGVGDECWALMRPGKRARVGTKIVFTNPSGARSTVTATVQAHNEDGHRLLRFSGVNNLLDDLSALGETPLPPYIKRATPNKRAEDLARYQTVYAAARGSVAAPTAGLHFTPEMLDHLRAQGVRIVRVTLHVGLGTFAPVKADTLAQHVMHEERYSVSEETAAEITAAKADGRRVMAVGTTTVRTLESVAAASKGRIVAGAGRTRIFIHPPFRFQLVDGLVTNFHLPCSTLLMLVSAFAAPAEARGRDEMLALYAEAVRQRYRFFSYGDAMLIL